MITIWPLRELWWVLQAEVPWRGAKRTAEEEHRSQKGVLVPVSPSHQRQPSLVASEESEETMATRHDSQVWKGGRPTERPAGQAGLWGHSECVSG